MTGGYLVTGTGACHFTCQAVTGNLAASVQLLSGALIKVYYRIHSFMREAFVFRIHPELRVGHLDEGLRGQGPGKRRGRQKTSDDHGFNW